MTLLLTSLLNVQHGYNHDKLYIYDAAVTERTTFTPIYAYVWWLTGSNVKYDGGKPLIKILHYPMIPKNTYLINYRPTLYKPSIQTIYEEDYALFSACDKSYYGSLYMSFNLHTFMYFQTRCMLFMNYPLVVKNSQQSLMAASSYYPALIGDFLLYNDSRSSVSYARGRILTTVVELYNEQPFTGDFKRNVTLNILYNIINNGSIDNISTSAAWYARMYEDALLGEFILPPGHIHYSPGWTPLLNIRYTIHIIAKIIMSYITLEADVYNTQHTFATLFSDPSET